MRVVAWLASAAALGGCDAVFGLDGADDQGSGPPMPDARGDASISDGLVAWYPMDRAGSTLADETGDGNDGTCTVNCPTATTGVVDGALDFDGVSESLFVAPHADLETTQAFTETEWIKIRSYRDVVTCPVSKVFAPASEADSWQGCVYPQGQIDFITATSANATEGDELFSTTTVALDEWHHLAFVWNGTFKTIYIDGEFNTTRMVPMVMFAGGGVGIGSDLDNVDIVAQFDGQLDDVRLYDRALDMSEVAQLYALGQP